MKKFLFVLILLIALGGAGFFLGWTHLTVPPGSYGVMRSKTHGLEPEVIRDGEFHWLWYKILPTNAEVSVYTIGPVTRSIRSSGTLSSAQVYAAFTGMEADFSWQINGEFTFSIRPEFLPEFTFKENIRDDAALRAAEDRLADRIENLVLLRLKAWSDSDDDKKIESLVLANSLPELNSEVERIFPEIEKFNCTIRAIRFPDYILYLSIKNLYRDYIAQQNAMLRPETTREAEKRIETRLRLDELAKYGELLTQFPVLLEYLALEKDLARIDALTGQGR